MYKLSFYLKLFNLFRFKICENVDIDMPLIFTNFICTQFILIYNNLYMQLEYGNWYEITIIGL